MASEEADRVIEEMASAGRTGQIGDGKVVVSPLDHALRIRTGETNNDAL